MMMIGHNSWAYKGGKEKGGGEGGYWKNLRGGEGES